MTGSLTAKQRARTAEQKSDRRETILAAADSLLREVGFEGFSMGELARKSGVAKGTLYLYFETREEVLLAIHNQQLAAWAGGFAASLEPGMSDQSLAELFFQSTRDDPVFLQLLARLDSVIEHNVSLEKLIEAKRLMLAQFELLSQRLESCLDLSADQASELLAGLTALMLGAQQSDTGPALAREDLPEDVRTLLDVFSADRVFIPNACRILRGLRQAD